MNNIELNKNTISITLDVPVETVFAFLTNPDNTPKWISFITKEIIDTEVPELGTVYTNDFGRLRMTEYSEPTMFEMRVIDGQYVVRYELQENLGGQTVLTYSEWMDDNSVLEEPFSADELQKLKDVIEHS